MTSSTKERHTDPTPLPVPPGPPPKIKTLLDALKAFLIADFGYALKHAWNANQHFTDFAQVSTLDHWSAMAQVTFNGFVYGLIPGVVLGLVVLLTAWAGPELWAYVGPILVIAAQKTMNFVRGFSLAVRGKRDTSSNDATDKGSETNG